MKGERYDAIVVGGGAAGLTAGIMLARTQVKVALIDSGNPRNAPSQGVRGLVSRDGMNPIDLQRTGKTEFEGYQGTLINGTVAQARRSEDDTFTLTLADNSELSSRTLVIATGTSDDLSGIPGTAELWGSLVHHCPHCHGAEVRGERIAVVGEKNLPATLHQAALMRRYSPDVTLHLNGLDVPVNELEQLRDFGVKIRDETVERFLPVDDSQVRIEFSNNKSETYESVFVAPLATPHDALLRQLGCHIEDGTNLVKVDGAGATSIPGVWAAGNVTNPRAQVVTSAGEAAVTAIAVTGWLLHQDLTSTTHPGPR